MEKNGREKCKIGYKVGVNEGGFIYGTRLFNLMECCAAFSIWFHETGNSKTVNFNSTNSEEKLGFNLVSRGDSLKLMLRDKDSREHEIKFCPFCGAEVRLIEACRVKLVAVLKPAHDHYVEETISRNSEITMPDGGL